HPPPHPARRPRDHHVHHPHHLRPRPPPLPPPRGPRPERGRARGCSRPPPAHPPRHPLYARRRGRGGRPPRRAVGAGLRVPRGRLAGRLPRHQRVLQRRVLDVLRLSHGVCHGPRPPRGRDDAHRRRRHRVPRSGGTVPPAEGYGARRAVPALGPL